jgi:hypothetical protein
MRSSFFCFILLFFISGSQTINAQQIKETWSEIKMTGFQNPFASSKASDILGSDETGIYIIEGAGRTYGSTGLSIKKVNPAGELLFSKEHYGKSSSGDDMGFTDALILKDRIAAFYFLHSKKKKSWTLGVLFLNKNTGEQDGAMHEIETVTAKNVYADDNICRYKFAVSPDGEHIAVVHQSLNDKEDANLLVNVYNSKFDLLWKGENQTTYQLFVTYCDNPAVDNLGNVYFTLRHDRADKKDVVGTWFYYVNAKSAAFTPVIFPELKSFLQDAKVQFNDKNQAIVFGIYEEDTTNKAVWNAGQFAAEMNAETGKPGKFTTMPLEQKSADALLKTVRNFGLSYAFPVLRIKAIMPISGGGYITSTEASATRLSVDKTVHNYYDVITARVGADLGFQWMTAVKRCLEPGIMKKTYGTVVSGKYVYVIYGDSDKNKDITKDNMYAEKPGMEMAYVPYKYEPVEYVIDLATGKVKERKYLPFPNSDLLYLTGTLCTDDPGKAWMLRCTDLNGKIFIGRLEFD